MATSPVVRFTEKQYLALERAAETRSEYYDGEMFAMAGGSPNHSFLCVQFALLVAPQLPQGCRMFNGDLRIRISALGKYTYADCGVICGEPHFHPDDDNLVNPVMTVEVLSPSTEAYDRGKKFESYQLIESFREYVLIHQDRPRVEHYSRQDDGTWILRISSGKDASMHIARFGATISLADLYSAAIGVD